jgi:multiple sugar transport system substrate-binding protein
VPTTWDEFRAAAKAVTKDGKFGVVSSGDTGGSHYLFAAILNNGGGLFDKDGKLTLTSNPRNVEAIDWLSSLVKDGSMNPGSAGFTGDDRVASFLKGDDAFMLDGPGLYNRPGAPTDDIAVLPPLKGPHGDTGTIFWVNNIMMYQQTQHPKETEEFMQWWSQHELPLWTAGHAGQIPARTSFVKDAAAGDTRYQQIVDMYLPVGKTTGTSYPGIFPQLSDIEGEGVMQTLTQQLWQGADPAQALSQAESTMNDIMSK